MSNIENFDIKSHVVESIVEVFDTMVSMEIEHTDSEPQVAADTSRVVAGVNFAGNIAGMLNIQVSTDFARQMTANMLDMEPEELEGDGEIKDLFSEISNIVGGNLKSALNDADLACVLSTPTMTYGGDFTIKSLNMERFERFVFMNQQDWVVVEVGIKTQQGAEDGEGLAAMDTLGRLQNVDAEKVNAIDINAKVAEEPPEPNASDSESVSQSDVDALLSETSNTESAEPVDLPPAEPAADPFPAQEQISAPQEDVDLSLLLDIPLEIKVELGRAKIQIQELLNLSPGSAVKLLKLEGEPVDILANDTLIARGEVVVQQEKYGIRVTEITSRLGRIRSFGL